MARGRSGPFSTNAPKGEKMKLKTKSIFILMAPAMLLFCGIFIYPTARTALMSFFDVKNVTSPFATWKFNGIDNYIRLFNTRLFRLSMVNIGKIWLFSGLAVIVLALFFSVILTRPVRGKKLFRAAIYLPNVIATVAIGYMWLLYVFNAKFGLFTTMFSALGLEGLASFQWTAPENLFLSMNIAFVFTNTGYYMMMYIAAIEKISPDYYEAATIEGASALKQFFTITLPLMKGVLGTSLVLWTSRTMAFFALSVVFQGMSTTTPMYYTYNALFGTETTAEGLNVGVAAGAAVIMTLIVMVVFIISNALIKDDFEEI